jgi:hypothetical protein
MEQMYVSFSKLKSLRLDCRTCKAAIEIPLQAVLTDPWVQFQRVLNLCQDGPPEPTADNKRHWEKLSQFCELLVEIQSSPVFKGLGMPLDIQLVSTSD